MQPVKEDFWIRLDNSWPELLLKLKWTQICIISSKDATQQSDSIFLSLETTVPLTPLPATELSIQLINFQKKVVLDMMKISTYK